MSLLKNLFGSLSKKVIAKKAAAGVAEVSVLPDSDAPWVKAKRQHENTNMRMNSQVANWRLFVFILLIVVSISVIGNVVQGTQSKMIPYIIEVDKLGRTVAVRALDGDDAVTDKRRLIYREMNEIIENIRSVSTDPKANKDRVSRAFSRLSGAAGNYVSEALKRNPPNVIGATQTVEIQIRAAIPISKKTWQVEWIEKTYSRSGELVKADNWKASLTYELIPSGLEENIRENPIGFTVNEISWLRII